MLTSVSSLVCGVFAYKHYGWPNILCISQLGLLPYGLEKYDGMKTVGWRLHIWKVIISWEKDIKVVGNCSPL